MKNKHAIFFAGFIGLLLALMAMPLAQAAFTVGTEPAALSLMNGSTATVNLTFTNTGNQSIQILSVARVDSVTEITNGPFSGLPLTVSPSATEKTPVQITASSTAPAGIHILNFSVTDNNSETHYAILTVNVTLTTAPPAAAPNNLRIVRVNFDSDQGRKTNLMDGDLIDIAAKPGSRISFDVRVENLFSSSIDRIRNVEVLAEILDIDDGSDMDEFSDSRDIRGGSREDYVLEFTVPSTADEGIYDVIILAQGSSINGTPQRDEIRLFLEIRRDRNDIRILSASFLNSNVCIGENALLRATIKNEGRVDQGNVVLTAENTQLGFSASERFSLRRYDRTDSQVSTSFSINTRGKQPGNYIIQLRAHYDGVHMTDFREVALTLRECQPTTPPPVDDTPIVIIEPRPPVDDTPPAETNGRLNLLYTTLLILGNIFIVFLIIFVVFRLITR